MTKSINFYIFITIWFAYFPRLFNLQCECQRRMELQVNPPFPKGIRFHPITGGKEEYYKLLDR